MKTSRPPRVARRRGIAALYITILMSVFFAFGSLALDFGKVQLVKSELRTATDSAARYGIRWISNKNMAQSRANNAAADNKVNGQPFQLGASNFEAGYWNTTTRVFTPNARPQNAVRLRTSLEVPLALAPLIGMQSCTVSAAAVAKCIPIGIVGQDGITFRNSTFVGSYDSSVTVSPTSATANSNATLTSNGYIGEHHHGVIKGDVYLGPGGSLATGWTISGGSGALSEAVTPPAEPAWNPTTNPGSIPASYTASSGTLNGGTYYFTSLALANNAAVTFNGATTIYVNGNITLGQGASLMAYQHLPANLTIYQIGNNRTFSGANNTVLKATIIAPRTDLTSQNNFKFYGVCYFRSITCNNIAEWFFDETAGQTVALAIVQ